MNLATLFNALPGAIAQGMIWGIMAIGLYITYNVLNFSDLTVDGTMATGGAVCIMLMMQGVNVWIALLCAIIAGMLAGLVTGLFHTGMGIPGILAGDGEDQDAYILGVDEPLDVFDGMVIAVLHRKDDVEEKWVVAPEGVSFSDEEILEKVHFTEQYFTTVLKRP